MHLDGLIIPLLATAACAATVAAVVLLRQQERLQEALDAAEERLAAARSAPGVDARALALVSAGSAREAGPALAAALGFTLALLAPAVSAAVLPLWAAAGLSVLASGAILAVCAKERWTALAWLPAVAILAMGLVLAILPRQQPETLAAATLLAAAATAMGLAYGWSAAGAPVGSLERFLGEPIGVGGALALGGVALAGGLALSQGHPWLAVGSLLGLVALLCAAGFLRIGFSPLAPAAALFAAAVLGLWPHAIPIADDVALRVEARGPFLAAGALGLLSSLGGWAMALRGAGARAGAALAGFGPLAALAAASTRAAELGAPPWSWTLAALGLAAIAGLALETLLPREAKGARGWVGLAAAACLATAVGWAPLPEGRGLAYALAVAVLTPLGTRWALDGVKFAALALCAACAATLLATTTGRAALPLALETGLAVATLLAAAALAQGGRAPGLARAIEFAAGALVVSIVLTVMRWAALAAAPTTAPLAELGGVTLALLALAAGLALAPERYTNHPTRIWGELGLIALAAAYAALAGLVAFNPWWGAAPAAIPGPPILNPLLFGYAAPALGFTGLAYLKHRQNWPARSRACAAFAAGFGLLWATLEARKAEIGADLTGLAAPAPHPDAAWITAAAFGMVAVAIVLGLVGARAPLIADLLLAPLRRSPAARSRKARRAAAASFKPVRPSRTVDPNLTPPQ